MQDTEMHYFLQMYLDSFENFNLSQINSYSQNFMGNDRKIATWMKTI